MKRQGLEYSTSLAFFCDGSVTFSSAGFSSCKGKATEPADNGHIVTEVVPPASIEWLVDSYTGFEDAYDQGNRGDPPMPDTHEETGWFAGTREKGARKAGCEQ